MRQGSNGKERDQRARYGVRDDSIMDSGEGSSDL